MAVILYSTKGVSSMAYQKIFKRVETKYLLSTEQYKRVLASMQAHTRGDEYGKSTICNIYFDTPDYLLIRRSMEKPIYKEKLRLRSYGTADHGSNAFAEIKKKYDDVVYKRRISLTEQQGMELLCSRKPCDDSQITHEILYFLEHYKYLRPAVFISYEREAYYDRENSDFRITFDRNILWRDWDVDLTKGVYGNPILSGGQVLMEVKAAGAMPRWFVDILNENRLNKTSFSKYGRAYEAIFRRDNSGRVHYA